MSFEKINNTLFFNFYFNEIWTIARSILELGEKLKKTESFLKYQADNNSRFLDSTVEVHEIISSILTHSARLDKFMHSSNQRDKETEEIYSFRKERAKILRKLILPKKKKPFEIFKAGVRNGIEHFDERLDLLSRKIIKGDNDINNKALLYNLTITNTDIFKGWKRALPFKVFVVSTGKYYIINHLFEEQSVMIYDLLEEIAKIDENCLNWSRKNKNEDGDFNTNPGGILKVHPHTQLIK
jgi:hypothetical protein